MTKQVSRPDPYSRTLGTDGSIHGPRQESLAECEGSCKGSASWTLHRPIFVSHCGPDGFPFGDQMASLSEDDICLQTLSANHPCLHNSLIATLPTYEAAETWASTRHRPLIKSLDWLFKVHNKDFLQHLLAIASEFSAESHGRTMVFVRSLYVYTVCVYLCVSVCVRAHTHT